MTGLDHGNNGEDAVAYMRAAIKIRWSSETKLMLISLPAHQWQSKITADFVMRGFRQSDWSMNADFAPPTKGDKKHSLLHFLPLLGDRFSDEFVPSGGIAWRLMLQWSRFIYYFYSLPGCKTGTDNYGGYDDTAFQTSEFGKTLMLMCRLVQNPALDRLWFLRQEQCTVNYIRDMSTLFELLGEFLEHRAGMSTECCGLDEATFEGSNGGIAVVAPATMLPNHITGQPSHFVHKLEAFRTRMTEVWGRDRYNENEAHWSTPSASLLLRQSDVDIPPPLIPRRHVQVDQENRDTSQRKQSPTPPTSQKAFKNTTPLYSYVGTARSGNDVELLVNLRKGVERGHFPWLYAPDDLDGEKHSLCLVSACARFCKCKNMRSCRTRYRLDGFSKSRLHVDLSDPKWSAAKYPESNWDAVVAFLKGHNGLVKPTEAFKRMTPNTQWQ